MTDVTQPSTLARGHRALCKPQPATPHLAHGRGRHTVGAINYLFVPCTVSLLRAPGAKRRLQRARTEPAVTHQTLRACFEQFDTNTGNQCHVDAVRPPHVSHVCPYFYHSALAQMQQTQQPGTALLFLRAIFMQKHPHLTHLPVCNQHLLRRWAAFQAPAVQQGCGGGAGTVL